jgi:hypothetical protein
MIKSSIPTNPLFGVYVTVLLDRVKSTPFVGSFLKVISATSPEDGASILTGVSMGAVKLRVAGVGGM